MKISSVSKQFAEDVNKLLKLCREQRDWINELEGWSPSSDGRNKYTDQLCCRVELQLDRLARNQEGTKYGKLSN